MRQSDFESHRDCCGWPYFIHLFEICSSFASLHIYVIIYIDIYTDNTSKVFEFVHSFNCFTFYFEFITCSVTNFLLDDHDFGFILADFKSTFAVAFSKLDVIVLKSSIKSAVNVLSSAKSRSANLFSYFHLMPLFTVSIALLIKKSITSKKSSVESMQPCLTPVLIRKKMDIPVSILI